MKDKLFKINTKIPKHETKIPLYQTFHFKSASSNNKEFLEYLNKRLKTLSSRFETKGELQNLGSQYMIKNEDEALEMYTASDSFWWTNRKHAYNENLKNADKLPSNDEAIERANKLIKALKIDDKYLKLSSVTHTNVAVSESIKNSTESIPTAVNVNYSYNIEGLAMFGSGAKTQLSFSNGTELVEFLHFYRNPVKTKQNIETISPEEALELVVNNFRFSQLKNSERNTGEITKIELGYYSADPSDLQKFLIPVYKVEGIVSTELLKDYKFNLFVIADKNDNEKERKNTPADSVLEKVFS